MADVSFKNISKSYPLKGREEKLVIEDLTLDIHDKELLVLVGPSGCGKSTLLRMIAGLEDATAGDIEIGGKRVNNLEPGKRNIAMVFQNYALYPHMTVYQNIAFGLRAMKLSKREIEYRVQQVAKVLSIEELIFRKPHELSGGQRQRVAIGRAMVREPSVFLFDEPLSNLDAKLRSSMRGEIKKLHQTVNTTIIYVTHDQTEAMTLADRIVVLNHGEIQQVGTPLELYENPANQFVAGFIGNPEMNFIRAPKGVAMGAITMGIRPEHISLAGEDAAPTGHKKIRGIITVIEPLGAETLLTVDYSGTELTAKITGLYTADVGDEVRLLLNMQKAYLFNEKGERV